MLFLLPRKFDGVESLNGGSALFSGGEIGSKIFRTCHRKQDISIMNITHYWILVGSVQWNGDSNLLCHHLGWCVAELLSCCAAALHRVVACEGSQQVGIDGLCQLMIGCGQISGTEGLCAGVVSLLSAPLQRHQQLLQGPEKAKIEKKNLPNI